MVLIMLNAISTIIGSTEIPSAQKVAESLQRLEKNKALRREPVWSEMKENVSQESLEIITEYVQQVEALGELISNSSLSSLNGESIDIFEKMLSSLEDICTEAIEAAAEVQCFDGCPSSLEKSTIERVQQLLEEIKETISQLYSPHIRINVPVSDTSVFLRTS